MSAEFLCRSVLYIPGSKERALEKARGLAADAIIFDLEDAVAPSEKENARSTLARELAAGGYGYRRRIVRINGLDTPWGPEDVAAVQSMDCDAILVPKVDSPASVSAIATLAPGVPVWCMAETPRSIFNALDIADMPEVEGFVLGTNDLAKDIGCVTGGDRAAMMTALQTCVLAASAAGIACVDGVYNAFKDTDGLEAECKQGRALGMDGKSLIHPAQIETSNRVFAPSGAAVELATRQIEAFETAEANGEGVAVLDGSIVENLHMVAARSVLAKAKAVREREAQ